MENGLTNTYQVSSEAVKILEQYDNVVTATTNTSSTPPRYYVGIMAPETSLVIEVTDLAYIGPLSQGGPGYKILHTPQQPMYAPPSDWTRLVRGEL